MAATEREAGLVAAQDSLAASPSLSPVQTKHIRKAFETLKGFRFHDLQHQAITELAEGGAADATLMAMAGHMAHKMLDHYSQNAGKA